MFGGLLLLGGRSGDLLGRRRIFITGIVIFAGAWLLGGLATDQTWLLSARALLSQTAVAAKAAGHHEHRPLAGAPAAYPSGLAGALQPGSPSVGDCFGPPAPILLTGAYLIAGILQPAFYSPVRETISVMAGQAGTDRWVMTGGIVLTGGCYLVTAAGLTGVRASAVPCSQWRA